MKVCFVFSTSEITGGANKSAIELIGFLDRDKVEVYALIKKHGDIEEELERLNIPIEVIPFVNNVSTKSTLLNCIKRIKGVITTKRIERFLLSKKIDAVHNNSLPSLAGMEAAFNLGIPYICHIREQVERGLGLQFLDRKKQFEVIKNASKIIAISRFVCSEYSDELQQERIEVLNDGIDTSLYLNENKTILTNETVNIGIYGNLDAQKGQMDAVRALESLHNRGHNNISLYIIGNQNTEYGSRLREYIKSRRMKGIITINPIRDIRELGRSRSNMDIILVCSSAEGLGRVTVESMLSGCLTIGASAGATPEIIRDRENGLLYECRNEEDLADKIEWAIINPDKSRKIAEKGRQEASKRFDISAYAKRIQSIYEQELHR